MATPPIKGGQGRDAEEVAFSAWVVTLAAAGWIASGLVLVIAGCL